MINLKIRINVDEQVLALPVDTQFVPGIPEKDPVVMVTCDPLDFNGKDHIALGEDTEPNFTGQEVSFGQFMTGDYDNDMTLS